MTTFSYRNVFSLQKKISSNIKYLKPNIKLIKAIYKIGLSAILMQALLAIMMSGMNAILNLASTNQTILIGSFGIYYKIQQIALFQPLAYQIQLFQYYRLTTEWKIKKELMTALNMELLILS